MNLDTYSAQLMILFSMDVFFPGKSWKPWVFSHQTWFSEFSCTFSLPIPGSSECDQERQAELKAEEELRLSEQRQKIKAEKAAAKARKVAEQKDRGWRWEKGRVEEDGKIWEDYCKHTKNDGTSSFLGESTI